MSMEYYALDRCLQCGICSSFCPNNLLKTTESFSPRNFIQKTRLGLLDLNGDELWMCTNCGHCQMVCPFEIPLLEVMASLRHLVVEQGAGYVPVSIKSSIASISSCGNPWKEETSSRIKWIQGTETVPLVASTEETVHIFLGCLSGYDRRARKAAEAAMYILQIAKIPFKILSDEEVCCGDTVRRVGDFTTSEKVKILTKNFLKNSVRKLYVLSPHCLSTFQEMYAKENNHETRITPLLEVVYDLIGKGIIKLNKYQDKELPFMIPAFQQAP